MSTRSPVIFWLLLAATICVDAVALSWVYPAPPYAVVAIDAILVAQLSIACIWSAFHTTKSVWTRITPILAVLLAASVIAACIPESVGFAVTFAIPLAQFGLQTALLVAALWLLQRTAFWRRTGSARPLQYSLAGLLAVMTVVAVLAAVLRDSPAFYGDRFGVVWRNVAFVCGSVALPVVGVVVWSFARHWFTRLAAVLGFAVLLGALAQLAESYALGPGPSLSMFGRIIGAYYLVQAVVLSAWLAWGQIIPVSHAAAGAQE